MNKLFKVRVGKWSDGTWRVMYPHPELGLVDMRCSGWDTAMMNAVEIAEWLKSGCPEYDGYDDDGDEDSGYDITIPWEPGETAEDVALTMLEFLAAERNDALLAPRFWTWLRKSAGLLTVREGRA